MTIPCSGSSLCCSGIGRAAAGAAGTGGGAGGGGAALRSVTARERRSTLLSSSRMRASRDMAGAVPGQERRRVRPRPRRPISGLIDRRSGVARRQLCPHRPANQADPRPERARLQGHLVRLHGTPRGSPLRKQLRSKDVVSRFSQQASNCHPLGKRHRRRTMRRQ